MSTQVMQNHAHAIREDGWSHDGSLAARCLALIERHAHKYTNGASFGFSREVAGCYVHRMTPLGRARAEAMLRQSRGRNQRIIGEKLGGYSQTAISRIWQAMQREGRA